MLDFELAKYYEYETKHFNEQVKNNIRKFQEKYQFQLKAFKTNQISRSKKSASISWSKKSTLNKTDNARGTNIKYKPYAFTEQGIYMVMTVLNGDPTAKQSIAHKWFIETYFLG